MSDTVSKADFDRLNAQFMTLQRELEAARKQPSAQQILLNPKAYYNEDGLNHLRNVLIADKLGDQAPMQLQIAANQGPMMAQFQQLAQVVQSLADKVNSTSTAHSQFTEREKFKSLITNTSKYPNLAKAYAKNPDKFLGSLEGTAEDYIAKQEASLKEIAEMLGVTPAPAPDATSTASENAGKQGEGKNTTIVSAQSGLLSDVPVPKPGTAPSGAWSKEVFAATKAKLLAEAEKGSR